LLVCRLALAPLLMSLLVFLVGCGGKPEPSTLISVPTATPAPQPSPSVAKGPVIYLAARPPGLRVSTSIEGVTVATTMADLKAMVGTVPNAIWIDASRAADVDTAWLEGLYNQRWPIMVVGPEATSVLERLLNLEPSPEVEQTAAMRQKSLSGNDVQARWLIQPGTAELISLHRALLSTVGSQSQ